MSGRSRGRGRAELWEDGGTERQPLRRPGDGRPPQPRAGTDGHVPQPRAGTDGHPPQPRAGTDGLVCPESRLGPPDGDASLSLTSPLSEQQITARLRATASDVQLLGELQALHEQALTSHTVGSRLASACGAVQANAPEASHLRSIRTHLLNFVQSNYKRRHDDRVGDPARFAAAAWLLCEVFRCVRLADGSVVRVLAAPILEYLSALLHCRPEHQVAAAAQLCRIGGHLNDCNAEAISELLNSIRERLISPDCGHALRADLLLCVELGACGWAPLSAHARHFYSHHGVAVPAEGPDQPWVGKPLPEDDWDD